MSLFITSLNSGSNGNCYYVGNTEEAILVDAGLSCKETEKRMERLGLSISLIKAIFISHEHSDHIFGLPVLAKKYRIPVYITDKTRLNCGFSLDPTLVNTFFPFQFISIGQLQVYSFPKYHDAADPHSFVVSYLHTRIGIFTDIGKPCNHVIDNFQKCNAVFLESNYDEEMLMTGRYPYHLKQRIRGGKGHLSNYEAFQLFTQHRPSNLTHLLLAHLSRENNSPEIVQQLFQPQSRNTKISVASRYCESEIFEIQGAIHNLPQFKIKTGQVQLSLF